MEAGLVAALCAALAGPQGKRQRVATAACQLLLNLAYFSDSRKDAIAGERGLVKALAAAFHRHKQLDVARHLMLSLAKDVPARRSQLAALLGGRDALDAVLG